MSISMVEMAGSASFVAAIVSILLAGVVTVKDWRSHTNRSFIAGLALLSTVELFRGLSAQSLQGQEVLYWQKMRIAFSAFLPGNWLLFSLTFARTEYKTFLSKWKWIIIAVFALPILAIGFLSHSVFTDLPTVDAQGANVLPLGAGGKTFHVLVLMSAVLILANLERTLRASTGRIRWQIKFVVLGLGSICALWVYDCSQALLYSSLNLSIAVLNPIVLLLADLLFVWGLIRSRFLTVDVYFSRTTIQYSLTVLFVGIYLLAVGLLAQLVRHFDQNRPLPIDALVVLLALVGLAVLLMSNRLQERLKRLIIRHLRRPKYDYRQAWLDLTQRTTTLSDVGQLCSELARILSQTLGFLSVNIWLRDETEPRLRLAGSTVFTRNQADELVHEGEGVAEMIHAVEKSREPIDLAQQKFDWPDLIMRAKPEYFGKYKMRYVAPVQTVGQLVGIITLNDDRVGFAPMSIEDQDLINAYSSHLAANVLQIRLSERLLQVKELESFQNVAAFFVHDLKNMASRLALAVQNLPLHYDNPEFRADVQRVIGQTVSQINETCSRLSMLKQKIEPKRAATDLNCLVQQTLESLRHNRSGSWETDLRSLPKVLIDPEQMQKVITNLVLNACEALDGRGKIKISTCQNCGQVVLSIEDSGCGMSQEFIERSLFQPFRSTKKRGMGIGLFHSKMIVEAHHGRIDVESQEGKGSVFRVFLPVR
ncbi:MAG TPA: XrtA/PEP-CTERM system histidine kinase PrsK [Acidobacteriota bacterium]|nr:XrtA/PEP-CTERM system histidine kinase PrsK [Acidobacteriota bacterium]